MAALWWMLLPLLILAGPAGAACAPESRLRLPQGELCGATSAHSEAVLVYKGLPYAEPPVPERQLRWQPPRPPLAWDGLRQALAFGPVCPQYGANGLEGAEDCLYLNIWTPKAAPGTQARLPVLVFLHGGGFTSGAGSLASYDGSSLAAQQAVVVTLNYRLGALGFLYADRAPGGPLEQPVPGNLGLLDQQAALAWVQAHIAVFGGDPARVTLFGESAGAMSAGLHLFAVPSSIPLFRAAIMESNPMGVLYPGPGQDSAWGENYLQHLCGPKVRSADCLPNTADLQAFSLAHVFQAASAYQTERMLKEADAGFPQSMPWGPLVDGTLVTSQPLDGYGPANAKAAKPFVFGMNGNEGVAFAAMTCAAFASNNGTPNPDPAEAARCLPPGSKASMMDPAWYDAAITQIYGPANAARVRAFSAADGSRPYDAHSLPGTAYYNPAAQAMAAVVGADNFICANLHAVDRVLQQVPGQQVHAYLFTQPPLFDLYADLGTRACAPEYGQVCHGDELAFLFDTLAVTSAEFHGILPVPAADQALAARMGKAWTRFARDLNMPAPWRPYRPGQGLIQVLNSSKPGQVDSATLNAQAHCASLWDSFYPQGRNSASLLRHPGRQDGKTRGR